MLGEKLLSLKFLVLGGIVLSAVVLAVVTIQASQASPSSITWERDYEGGCRESQRGEEADHRLHVHRLVCDLQKDECRDVRRAAAD